jgi:hypothetical protein
MGLARGKYAGDGREVSLARTLIAPGCDPDGVRGELARTPRVIMWGGVVILVVLGAIAGVFGAVGVLVILFGWWLYRRRMAAANRYYAQKRAERDICRVWQSMTGRRANDNLGGQHTVKRPDSTLSSTPEKSSESRSGVGQPYGDESLDAAPMSQSDAA